MRIPDSRFHMHGNNLKRTTLLLFFTIALISFSVFAQQPAFPSATGAGAYVTGGRGMQVFQVTNLNASGAGSLSSAIDAVRNNGGGIVTFTVSGTIELPSVMSKSDINNITIAGQTAPAGGITITGNKMDMVRWNNFIIRYIKFRPLYDPPTNIEDGARFYDCTNGIVDHCSFSWGKDEVVSSTGYNTTHTITWQRNLIAEGKTGSLFGDSDNPDGSYDLSFHNNAYYNITHRFPNINSSGRADHINNVVYNWNYRLSYFGGDIELNSVNNFYVPGCKSSYDDFVNKVAYRAAHTPEIFASGNIIDGMFDDPNADNWELFEWFLPVSGGPYSGSAQDSQLTTDYQVNNQFPLLGRPLAIQTAQDAFADVTTDVGANAFLDQNGERVDNVDSLDSMYLNNIIVGDCVSYESSSSYQDYPTNQHYIDFHNNVSNVPFANGYLDSNNDGMPDAWKLLKGFGINDDLTTHLWASGYVGIEEFLNEIDGPSAPPVNVTGVAVTPQTATINVPETVTLLRTITPTNATNQSGVWSTSDATIATVDNYGLVSSVAEGNVVITYTTNDGSFTDSAAITVTAIPIPVESVTVSPETLNVGLFANPVLTANILPVTATNQTGVWSSSDEAVATIAQDGTLSPVAIGTTTITFTTNDGGFSDTAEVTINNDHFGTYQLYNADTDELIQLVSGGEVFDINLIGENINFRSIPQGGDGNPQVESVRVQWDGIENGLWTESVPIYAGMTDHTGNDYAPYPVQEGTYNFTVTYFSENSGNGNVVSTDNFNITFTRGLAVSAGEDQSICEGESVTLTATGAETYLWSTGETTASIVVSPNVTTTYTVTGTDPGGNSASDDVIVTVNAMPTVDAGVDQTICNGATVTLTASDSNGTYQWSSGETTQSITVSPNQNTTYTVIVTENGCSSSDDVQVSVNASPNANAGNDITILDGETTTLTASGGGTYVWSTGETTESIDVSPTATTTYSVTVTNDEGTCSDTDDVIVYVGTQVIANAGDDVSICEGENTTLTATGGDTYEWSTGETTQSITVSPNTTTTYTVTVSNNFTSDTDDVIVTVNAVPIADAGGDVTIAQGDNAVLTATGGATYLWSTGETTASIIVFPSTSTTYSVTVTNTEGTCNDTDEVTVNIAAQVIADAGEDVTICEGVSVTLTASGGDTYEWSTGQTTQSITVNPLNTTTYTVTVSNGFTTDTDDVTVTVNPLPEVNAGADVTIMFGENTILTASGGNSYLWSTGETAASISVSPTQTTTYTVSTTIGGCSDTDEVTVTVEGSIEAHAGEDVVDLCIGDSVVLTATGGDTYEWNTGETTQSITVSPEVDTIYTVTVSNEFTSDSDDVSVFVIDCEIAAPDPLDFEFKAFPNPTTGPLTVIVEGIYYDANIYLYDLLGKQMFAEIIPTNDGQRTTITIDMSSMAKGFYMLSLQGQDAFKTKKIVLK